ncbi:guanitoxin biosynthesis heme-dependent pre-guanitoxin N-hydroxylase GntA [Flexivirga alba]|uniref:Guanitoxin biosynthesis heme-dependent pre-guanitoxin N-hydroxylase GntA n=1 Tax=Flexivirga alba TaxID=702742 RepID=A0ABW2AKD3_9MICO
MADRWVLRWNGHEESHFHDTQAQRQRRTGGHLGPTPPRDADDDTLAETFRTMIQHPDYPCLGARSVVNRHRASVLVLPRLGGGNAAPQLLDGLSRFAAETNVDEGFASFVCIFRQPERTDEKSFEQLLWQQLQSIADADNAPWSREVSDDPVEPHFSFSAAGTAYFVVGLHPDASRIARRAPWPTLVFNLHEQFQNLRTDGGFDRMRERIRSRDSELQGCPNPMVEDFGDASEARQYSGRAVKAEWTPPADFGATEHNGQGQ